MKPKKSDCSAHEDCSGDNIRSNSYCYGVLQWLIQKHFIRI
nr:MAG TPA: hypothetical protein [Caudoviricetes sp.]